MTPLKLPSKPRLNKKDIVTDEKMKFFSLLCHLSKSRFSGQTYMNHKDLLLSYNQLLVQLYLEFHMKRWRMGRGGEKKDLDNTFFFLSFQRCNVEHWCMEFYTSRHINPVWKVSQDPKICAREGGNLYKII